ncbi:hypothetical protein L2E82_27290 [Cichorium intybus]|uniref:Uncharacterized protein n=1 Tax=Cichorium intybus TaxID=13427 RepID=A0ACB9CSY5_CICIN|nr:hypothetical protein L2E82_27290 [Cichorium intybus]
MSFHDAYQSRICSRQSVGSPKTNNLGDDDSLARLASHREQDSLSNFDQSIEKDIARQIKEAIELSHKNQATASSHRTGNSESRSLELRFSNDMVPMFLTGDHIKAIGGVPLEVTLVDSHTTQAVKSGPGASGRVEIVVLESQIDGVTGEDVKSNCILVWQMEGSKSNRVDNFFLNLIQGTALLRMVSFARNEKWTKKSKLRLGAKFVDDFNGLQIKEAKTGTFLLKYCRTKGEQ